MSKKDGLPRSYNINLFERIPQALMAIQGHVARESELAEMLFHDVFSIHMACIKLAMSEQLVLREDVKDPLWALSLEQRGSMGQPTLDNAPPVNVVVKQEAPVEPTQAKPVDPNSPEAKAHAAFLARIGEARTAFKERLATHRNPVEPAKEVKEKKKSGKKKM